MSFLNKEMLGRFVTLAVPVNEAAYLQRFGNTFDIGKRKYSVSMWPRFMEYEMYPGIVYHLEEAEANPQHTIGITIHELNRRDSEYPPSSHFIIGGGNIVRISPLVPPRLPDESVTVFKSVPSTLANRVAELAEIGFKLTPLLI